MTSAIPDHVVATTGEPLDRRQGTVISLIPGPGCLTPDP